MFNKWYPDGVQGTVSVVGMGKKWLRIFIYPSFDISVSISTRSVDCSSDEQSTGPRLPYLAGTFQNGP